MELSDDELETLRLATPPRAQFEELMGQATGRIRDQRTAVVAAFGLIPEETTPTEEQS